MAKDQTLKPDKLFGALALIWGANFLSAQFFDFPFLYCWLSPFAAAIYIGSGLIVMYALCAYSVFYLIKGRMTNALCGALILIAFIELPNVAVYLFRQGGSCG